MARLCAGNVNSTPPLKRSVYKKNHASEMIAPWKETTLSKLLSMAYKTFKMLMNLYSFIKCTLKSLCIYKKKKFIGGTQSKIKIT